MDPIEVCCLCLQQSKTILVVNFHEILRFQHQESTENRYGFRLVLLSIWIQLKYAACVFNILIVNFNEMFRFQNHKSSENRYGFRSAMPSILIQRRWTCIDFAKASNQIPRILTAARRNPAALWSQKQTNTGPRARAVAYYYYYYYYYY